MIDQHSFPLGKSKERKITKLILRGVFVWFVIHFTELQTYPGISGYSSFIHVDLGTIHTTTVKLNRMNMNLSQIKLVVVCFLKTKSVSERFTSTHLTL